PDDDAAVLEDAAAEAQCGDRAEAVVHVRPGLAPAQGGHDVPGQELSLPHGVLGVRYGHGAGPARGQVGDRRVVAGAPGAGHRFAVRADPQVGPDDQQAAPVDGQVGVTAHHRVGVVADGPYEQVGVELL